MKLFCLRHNDYEAANIYYFMGPDNVSHEQFNTLCSTLLDEAAINAIVSEKKKQYKSVIGWFEIVENMIPLLEKQGYYIFKPIFADFNGSYFHERDFHLAKNKGLSAKIIRAILNFNERLDDYYE